MLEFALGGSRERALRILCLGAHSDDIEIGCGATVMRLLAERPGSHVTWVVFSANSHREREARASAADFLSDACGSDVLVQSFRESYFPYEGSAVKDYFETLKDVRPDLVLSHHVGDIHQDHRLIAELTWNTFRNHVIAEYEIPKYEGDLGHPNMYVPVSEDVAEHKVGLLLKHFGSQHQRSWFRAETFRATMALRGVECNSTSGFAEAFHVRKVVV
jgi:LmbE family N-acetylglucosaminyl deacetylase